METIDVTSLPPEQQQHIIDWVIRFNSQSQTQQQQSQSQPVIVPETESIDESESDPISSSACVIPETAIPTPPSSTPSTPLPTPPNAPSTPESKLISVPSSNDHTFETPCDDGEVSKSQEPYIDFASYEVDTQSENISMCGSQMKLKCVAFSM